MGTITPNPSLFLVLCDAAYIAGTGPGSERERRREPHEHWLHGPVWKRTMQRVKNPKTRLSVENYKNRFEI